MSNGYKIVYGGSLKAGTDPEQFVRRFMEIFHVPEANARKLVSIGKAVTLKTRLEQSQAEKVRETMEALGMEVRIEPMAADGSEGAASSPAPAPAAPDAGPRCPKCGSTRISGDDCLACGIIIPRFKEKQARAAAEAAAKAEAAAGAQEEMATSDTPPSGEPRRVAAGNGWHWITEGWGLVRQSPLAWIGATLVWMLLMGLSGVVPLIGPIAVSIAGPVLMAGFMLGAHEQQEGGTFEFRHLFAGFAHHAGPLLVVGVFYLAGLITILLVAAMVFGGTLTSLNSSPASNVGLEVLASLLGLLLLVAALMVPLMMAYWFAPALVALGEMSAVDAMKASFVACLKNTVPFLIYGLLLMVLSVVAMIPFGLGIFVLMPVMVASMYTSWRDIFSPPANG